MNARRWDEIRASFDEVVALEASARGRRLDAMRASDTELFDAVQALLSAVPGDDLWSRLQQALGDAYHIERELGGGGSSRVFVAIETALDRRVAIKVLPPEVASELDTERFHREVQLAAQLQHPHIVPLLAAGSADGLLYYMMPLVDGESLRERLAHGGALPIPEVVRILREMSDALAYAHAHGIVHRDIKPGNTLLSAGHALVADFGVSKALSGATSGATLTATGVALGTPAYMAPEQATADPRADHRADLYALGAVGYEMLTGQPPFTEPTVRQVLAAQATQVPVPVTQRRTAVPHALAALVMQCLEKEPSDRPQSAVEVREVLDTLSAPRGGSAGRSEGAPRRHRRAFTAAVAAVVLGGIALGTALAYRARVVRDGLDAHRVMIAPFENKSGDPRLDAIGTLAADWIARGLNESGVGDVASAAPRRDRAGAILPGELDPPALARQARALGAGRVLSGMLYLARDSVQLHVQIRDASDGTLLIAVPAASGVLSDPMVAINAMRTRALGALAQVGPSESVGIASPDAPPSYAAYREFLLGEEAHSIGDFASTIEHDRRALALDSTYLAPLVRMAYAFFNQQRCDQADSVGGILNARRERVPLYEGYYLDRVLAWCRGDLNAAYLAAKKMVAVAPHSSSAKYVSARSAFFVNRPREAVDALEGLDWKKPHISGYYDDLGKALHVLGRHKRELEVARLYRERVVGSLLPLQGLVRALSALGPVDEARREAEASLAMSSLERAASSATVMLTAAEELTAHGRPEAGRRIAQTLVTWLRDRPGGPQDTVMMVRAHIAAGQPGDAFMLAKRLLAAHGDVVENMTLAGVTAAALGNRAEALRLSSTLGAMSGPHLAGSNIYGQAAIAAQLGDKARAVALLREAIRRGQSEIRQGDADLALLPLRGYAPYDDLMKPEG